MKLQDTSSIGHCGRNWRQGGAAANFDALISLGAHEQT
jgi:hypothetical protein